MTNGRREDISIRWTSDTAMDYMARLGYGERQAYLNQMVEALAAKAKPGEVLRIVDPILVENIVAETVPQTVGALRADGLLLVSAEELRALIQQTMRELLPQLPRGGGRPPAAEPTGQPQSGWLPVSAAPSIPRLAALQIRRDGHIYGGTLVEGPQGGLAVTQPGQQKVLPLVASDVLRPIRVGARAGAAVQYADGAPGLPTTPPTVLLRDTPVAVRHPQDADLLMIGLVDHDGAEWFLNLGGGTRGGLSAGTWASVDLTVPE